MKKIKTLIILVCFTISSLVHAWLFTAAVAAGTALAGAVGGYFFGRSRGYQRGYYDGGSGRSYGTSRGGISGGRKSFYRNHYVTNNVHVHIDISRLANEINQMGKEVSEAIRQSSDHDLRVEDIKYFKETYKLDLLGPLVNINIDEPKWREFVLKNGKSELHKLLDENLSIVVQRIAEAEQILEHFVGDAKETAHAQAMVPVILSASGHFIPAEEVAEAKVALGLSDEEFNQLTDYITALSDAMKKGRSDEKIGFHQALEQGMIESNRELLTHLLNSSTDEAVTLAYGKEFACSLGEAYFRQFAQGTPDKLKALRDNVSLSIGDSREERSTKRSMMDNIYHSYDDGNRYIQQRVSSTFRSLDISINEDEVASYLAENDYQIGSLGQLVAGLKSEKMADMQSEFASENRKTIRTSQGSKSLSDIYNENNTDFDTYANALFERGIRRNLERTIDNIIMKAQDEVDGGEAYAKCQLELADYNYARGVIQLGRGIMDQVGAIAQTQEALLLSEEVVTGARVVGEGQVVDSTKDEDQALAQ